MTEPVVTLEDCRTLKYCASGIRAFFVRHALDWATFRRHGLPASVLDRTGDAMAIAAANVARGRQRGQQ